MQLLKYARVLKIQTEANATSVRKPKGIVSFTTLKEIEGESDRHEEQNVMVCPHSFCRE